MRRVGYLLGGLLLIGLLLGGWLTRAHAQVFRTGDSVSTSQNGTVNSSLYIAGQTVDVGGTVRGDVFCAGQNVNVSADVSGDVICAGQNITVTGKVSGDVRLLGQSVTIGADVQGNASVAAQSLTEDARAHIGGDLSIAAGQVRLNGPVGRDLAASAEDLTLASSVGRNVQAWVHQLTLADSAQVGGNIVYTSEHTVKRAPGATVSGGIAHRLPPAKHTSAAVGWLWLLYLFVALLLTALLLVLLLPQVFHRAAEAARGRLLRTFLIGFIASIVVPVVLLALALTLVGLPLALLAGLVWLLIDLLSAPFAAYLLGRLLLHRVTDNAIWTMLLGAAVLLLLGLVPFLGLLTSLVAYWFGLGTILQYGRFWPRPRYRLGEPAETTAPAKVG